MMSKTMVTVWWTSSAPPQMTARCRPSLTSRYPRPIAWLDEVQALVGRITDRRIVTYGFNAQADVRAVGLHYKGGIAHFDIDAAIVTPQADLRSREKSIAK